MGSSPQDCKRIRHDLVTKQQQISEISEMKSLRELSMLCQWKKVDCMERSWLDTHPAFSGFMFSTESV